MNSGAIGSIHLVSNGLGLSLYMIMRVVFMVFAVNVVFHHSYPLIVRFLSICMLIV